MLLDKKELHRTLETLEKSHHRLLINVRDTMISDPDGNYAAFLRGDVQQRQHDFVF